MADLGSILVIAAHPDDECLGAGGTVRNHTRAGVPVDLLCLTGNDIRNEELASASDILGVRNLYPSNRDDFDIDRSLSDSVVEVILESRPTAIITHSDEDYNRNHRICAEIVNDSIEWASHKTMYEEPHRVEQVLQMEINTLHSHPHFIVDITASYDESLLALKKYESQLSKADEFYLDFYDARTRLRGVQGACSRAEAFTVSTPRHAGPFYQKNSRELLI